jgi:hypothetical protein
MAPLLASVLSFLNVTLQLNPYSQYVLQPVESADTLNKRQAAQPFNNDYNGPQFTSPPSYPSPWGSGAGDWAAAYEKARAFVSQLTLLEKVNLTTGVGWVLKSLGSGHEANSFSGGKASDVSEMSVKSLDLGSPVFVCKTAPLVSEMVCRSPMRDTSLAC